MSDLPTTDDWLAEVFARFTERLQDATPEGAAQALQGGLFAELRTAAEGQVDTAFDRGFEAQWDRAGALPDTERIAVRKQLQDLRASRGPLDLGPDPEVPAPPRPSAAAPLVGAAGGAVTGAAVGAAIGRGAPPFAIGGGVAGAAVGATVGVGVEVVRRPGALSDYKRRILALGQDRRRTVAAAVARRLEADHVALASLATGSSGSSDG